LKKIDDYLSKQLTLTIDNELSQETSALYTIIIIVTILVLFILIFSKFVADGVTNAINKFQLGLLDFFRYLNKEIDQIQLLDDSHNDEIGVMSKVINENITKTKQSIDEDNNFIQNTQKVMLALQNGSFEQEISEITHNPSLQLLKDTINNSLRTLRERISIMNNVLEKYASLDYRDKLKVDGIRSNSAIGTLIVDINKLRDVITKMLIENKANGLTLQDSSNLLLKNVDILNKNSTDSAIAIDQTSNAVKDITVNIDANTQNVIQMASNAQILSNSATTGEQLASKTAYAMDDINTEVTAINDAISVIDQIAFQTNILSLNAAVEAATAGEAGKGFAVVAQEVRNLASRSAQAAAEIKSIVEKANAKALEGKSISDKMIEGYGHLNENISNTIELIKNVEQASKEQQIGIQKINSTINSLDDQTKQNASIAATTHEVAVQTDTIAKLIVSNANEKEFIGKDLTKRKKTVDLNYTGLEKRAAERLIKERL